MVGYRSRLGRSVILGSRGLNLSDVRSGNSLGSQDTDVDDM